MQLFLQGASDATVARRFAVSPSTVAAQRFKRGVYRDMRPGPPRLPEATLEAEAEPLPPQPVLRPAQTAPVEDGKGGAWRTWLFLGGRGAGKTLAGAAWLAGRAKAGGRLALVGPTYADVREVMIDGPSGLRGLGAAFGPEGGRPRYEPSRRRLVWPNGAVAFVFTAEEPDGLRGPQFHAAWADELCVWPRASETLAQLRLGLRLGEDPKLMITTTPRPIAALRALMAEPGLAITRGSAAENAAHLAPGFLEGLRALYGGTRLERQEMDGEVLEALSGAVFRAEDLNRARAAWAEGAPERYDRLVVAVDPPAGLHGAACGVVTAARSGGRAFVLADDTVAGLSPLSWAQRVGLAAERAGRFGPVEVVAEANQGGEMVRTVLTTAGVGAPLRLVHARAGKAARAEPVALLYEQGRVAHAPGLRALEDQMLLLGAEGEGARAPSPDRADALVWALTALMLGRPAAPRVRGL
jgi:phage terminase large subunit-like protein